MGLFNEDHEGSWGYDQGDWHYCRSTDPINGCQVEISCGSGYRSLKIRCLGLREVAALALDEHRERAARLLDRMRPHFYKSAQGFALPEVRLDLWPSIAEKASALAWEFSSWGQTTFEGSVSHYFPDSILHLVGISPNEVVRMVDRARGESVAAWTASRIIGFNTSQKECRSLLRPETGRPGWFKLLSFFDREWVRHINHFDVYAAKPDIMVCNGFRQCRPEEKIPDEIKYLGRFPEQGIVFSARRLGGRNWTDARPIPQVDVQTGDLMPLRNWR